MGWESQRISSSCGIGSLLRTDFLRCDKSNRKLRLKSFIVVFLAKGERRKAKGEIQSSPFRVRVTSTVRGSDPPFKFCSGLAGLCIGLYAFLLGEGSSKITFALLAVEFPLGWFFFAVFVLSSYPFSVARSAGPMPGLTGTQSNALIMMVRFVTLTLVYSSAP
jgi:hypothetical protein